MKKYKIQLNARAYRDLEEIFEYIANDLQSPEYAKGQTDRLWKSLKTLEIFPSSHQERLVGNYAGKGYRQLLIDNYLAIFNNFSNHPSKAWGKTQLNAAMEYGEVIDIPFPAVNPYSNKEEIYKISSF